MKRLLRSLRRDLGYSATSVITLALTIGATTATFSIVNGVLLRPLAYRESHQLVALREILVELQDRYPVLPLNGRHFEEWRTQAQTFDSMAEYRPVSANLTGVGEPVQVALVQASGGLFDVLQAQPALGRGLRVDDEKAETPDVVIIGTALWRARFGSDPSIVGRAIVLDGKPHTVVGVLAGGFQLPVATRMDATAQLTGDVDVVVPLRLPSGLGWAGDHNYVALGRLKRGVTVDQARAELDVIQSRVAKRVGDEERAPITLKAHVTPLSDAVTGTARRGLWLLLGAVGAVLLIACSNLANLSLTRMTARLRDAMIRTALGASRSRLVGEALAEQLVVAAAGGALGMLIARAGLRTFVLTAPIELPRVNEVTLDARVFAFCAIVSIAAGAATALLPAWSLIRRQAHPSLRAGGWGATADRYGVRSRTALLALQVALSVTLLVVTALLGVSFLRIMRVDRGFASDRVLAVNVALPSSRYATAPARIAVYDRVLEQIHSVPGVEAVSWLSKLPLQGDDWGDVITVDGDTRPVVERPMASYRFVAPEFFKTLSMTIRRGRAFTDDERGPDRPTLPAVVSEAAAARAWPGQDALGKRFHRAAIEKPFEVVGIAADARMTSIGATPGPMVYVPYWFRSRAAAALVVRTHGEPAAVAASVRRGIQAVDPEIAVGDTRPLDRIVDSAFAARRYQMLLFVAFGAVALLIATVGVYATTSYGVARRRREMNIRVALGAQANQVVGMVVRQGSRPIIVGALAGAAGAVAAGGLVASLLFDVTARDPLVIGGVVSAVCGIGILACLVAARQGLSLDPAAALRDE